MVTDGKEFQKAYYGCFSHLFKEELNKFSDISFCSNMFSFLLFPKYIFLQEIKAM